MEQEPAEHVPGTTVREERDFVITTTVMSKTKAMAMVPPDQRTAIHVDVSPHSGREGPNPGFSRALWYQGPQTPVYVCWESNGDGPYEPVIVYWDAAMRTWNAMVKEQDGSNVHYGQYKRPLTDPTGAPYDPNTPVGVYQQTYSHPVNATFDDAMYVLNE